MPEVCPNCGAEVPPRARACPECGADEQTGWSEQAAADALGLPDENFDYEDFVGREFGSHKPKREFHWFWWLVAAALLGLFLSFWLLR